MIKRKPLSASTGVIIALVLFSASLFPFPATASEKPDTTISGMIALMKLALAHKNGQVQLNQEEIAAIKEEAIATLDAMFQKIDKAGITAEDLRKYEQILPKNLSKILGNLLAVSKLNASTEEKIAAMMGTFADCTSYLYTFLALLAFSFVFGSIPVIGSLIYLGEVAYAVFAVLCYLGIV